MILSAAGLIDLLASLAGVGALVLTAGMYVEFQRRRDKLTAIRDAFEITVRDLASTEETQRLATAILLRRFFDEKSELGIRSTFHRQRSAPYAQEALNVMAAVLRGLETGNFQKLLADGLAYAPDLRKADLQRANLQNAYLGPHRVSAALEHADFYRADLSGASLKDSQATEAVFYQARLHSTIFKGANLAKANFYQADLSGAQFAGATLTGANFKEAVNVPSSISPFLDPADIFLSDDPVPDASTAPPQSNDPRQVFFSLPSRRSEHEQEVVRRVISILDDAGIAPTFLTPPEYPVSGQLCEVRRRMAACRGIVIFGFEGQSHDAAVAFDDRRSPTPWNHLEAGMAYALGLPVLVVASPAPGHGIFDTDISEPLVHRVAVDGVFEAVPGSLRHWLALVT